MTAAKTFLTASSIARYCGLDRRTVALRLTRSYHDPDALLHEPSGLVSLWDRDRLADLLDALERFGPLPIEANLPSELTTYEDISE